MCTGTCPCPATRDVCTAPQIFITLPISACSLALANAYLFPAIGSAAVLLLSIICLLLTQVGASERSRLSRHTQLSTPPNPTAIRHLTPPDAT